MPSHREPFPGSFGLQIIFCLFPVGQFLIRKLGLPAGHHKLPVPGPVGQTPVPGPGAGPGRDFPEVKRKPGDRIEEQRIPVGQEPGSQRFLVVEHLLVPPIPQLIPVPGPEPNWPGGGGGGGGGGERRQYEAKKVKTEPR